MAENICGRDGVATVARRSSFRKTVRENQSILPEQYLEALEQKRRQLDESIHKYVAAKEREYKVYEKDMRQQAKCADGVPTPSAQQDESPNDNTTTGLAKRRPSSEGASAGSPQLLGQEPPAADLMEETSKQALVDSDDKQSVASADTVGSKRERDFLGVFTPQFLPALDNGGVPTLIRADSAPATLEMGKGQVPANDNYTLQKADSDSGLQAKAKRPAHLRAIGRTSSSGSSADGRLASAMKSPAHHANPSRKRVSLAVGDSIVAPSDNVPLALDHHSTPSHSRTRVLVTEQGPTVADEKATAIMDFAAPPSLSSMQRVEHIMNGVPALVDQLDQRSTGSGIASAPLDMTTSRGTAAPARTQSNIDPDGDLFDLEDDSAIPHSQDEKDAFDKALEAEDDTASGVLGRVDSNVDTVEPTGLPMASPGVLEGQHAHDSGSDSGPEAIRSLSPDSLKGDEHAVHLEFGPGFATASQQPTLPGFRRPSVNADPVFQGSDYQAVEARAVEEEVYGSSFVRPRGSFAGGSLGGSYMAQHAEGMMKMRLAQKQNG